MNGKWLDDEELKRILGLTDELEEELTPERPKKARSIEEEAEHSRQAVETHAVHFEELSEEEFAGEMAEFELLYDIPLELRVILGSVEKTIEEILEMEEGTVFQTERLAGEPVEIMVADQVIAKGEIVIIDDKFGVLITEIVPPRERIQQVEGKLKRQKS